MANLKTFCTPNWPDKATEANNPEWQAVVNYLLLEAFKRRIGATNEDSAGKYPEGTNSKYACEYWRINACLMVIGQVFNVQICAIPLGTDAKIENIPIGRGMKHGGRVHQSVVDFLGGESHAATSSNSAQVFFNENKLTLVNGCIV